MGKSRTKADDEGSGEQQKAAEAEREARELFDYRLERAESEFREILIEGVEKWGFEQRHLLRPVYQSLYWAMNTLIDRMIDKAIASGELKTAKGKQELAKKVNSALRRCNAWIVHPDTGERCFLVALNDKWGGKFALESKATGKRTCTTADIATLHPFGRHQEVLDDF